MTVSYSRNLRLRIDSNLTANAKYNLERIDLLGASLLVDTTGTVNIRSEGNINMEPESPDIGGSGVGGSVNYGSVDHQLSSVNFYADSVLLGSSAAIADSAVGGDFSLLLKYKSDLSGAFDTADRSLIVDLNGADRQLILGGNLALLGGGLSLSVPADLAYTYPSGYGTPGQVWAGDGSGGWIWTDMSGGSGGGDVSGYSTSWATGDGLTKAVTHGLNSNNVEVVVIDENKEVILVDHMVATSTNIVTLTASETPATSWTVVIQAK